MVTRKELEGYRSSRDELRDLRARMRQAELAAMESDRESDRERAITAAQRYETLADERADEMERIEAEIDNLGKSDQRRIVRMRYIDGLRIRDIARRVSYSERQVKRIIDAAVAELEQE